MSYMELPKLEDYEVSPKTGFLPDELPIRRLSDSYFDPWEDLVEELPSLILVKKIRELVDELPILSVERIASDKRELRRAYSILGFLSHAYVWNVDIATENLPKALAKPLIEASEILEVPPLATYAGLILWNFRPIRKSAETFDLDNLTTINTYTGSIDESWFYLVSVYFEYKGAGCITGGLDAMKYVREDSIEKVTESLKSLAEAIDMLGSVLMRMEEMCDPHTFYYRIRPYLAGWKNMADAGLPNGLKYGDEEEYRSYAGGSNAQSSLIQTLDIILGVEHYPTGQREETRDSKVVSASSGSNNFMNEMRKYMPGPHRRFLEHLGQVANIRSYVTEKNDSLLTLAYDASVAMLKAFRDKHIQIVTRYIILQAGAFKKSGSKNTLRSGISKTAEKKDQKGTGGTALMPFLKQCRDETGDTAAGEWGQSILSKNVLTSRPREDDTPGVDTKRPKLGLAGSWSSSDDGAAAGHW
ncbi:CYFA0S17e02256g1_1 [Cyberlindnera fabianii]|uniref:Indoleamine 2,3-dioxygenase n=1 Tax=Cyberlindnera fabianii TaxID=36022 RepID=A0A061BBU0_CYBFA|nr:Indoleamine 2,3-dioxygenase [Cyberlindnera fabianii]CDR45352.1 CYFA0S17e02256g1_1 [Cyberlindnera fabianii]